MINRSEAKEKEATENTAENGMKVGDEKPCELYMQNESLSVISGIKSM